MTGVRTECVVEHALGTQDHCAEEPRGVLERHEGHEVHPLVLCLFKESVDPTMVSSLQRSKRK